MTLSKKTPPLLPTEVLKRVSRVAAIDGRFLLFLAGTFAILSAAEGDMVGAIIGCVAAGSGALELHGVSQLRGGEPRGLDWLVRSQLLLLATILIYCAIRIASFDFEKFKNLVTPVLEKLPIEDALEQLHLTLNEYLRIVARVYQWGYVVVGAVSVFYQGGLAL